MTSDLTNLEIPVTITDGSDEVCSYKIDNSESISLLLEADTVDSFKVFDNTNLALTSGNIEGLTTFYLLASKSSTIKIS